MKAYKKAAISAAKGFHIGSLLNLLLQNFAFWSKENTSDYYASLEDESPYYSLTEKE